MLLRPYSQNGASFSFFFCRIRVSAKMGGLPSSTGQLPSAADGSRIDATPNGRIASAANTNGRAGRWGGVLLPHMPCGPAAASQGPRHLCVQLPCCGPRGVPGRASQGPRHLRPSPCRLALRHGGMSVRALGTCSIPLTQFPGGRSPPCRTECPRSRQCPRRGRWRPRSPVLHRAPRPSTCSGR